MEDKLINRFPAGVVRIPPSKSVSHRAAICAALAGGDAAGARVFLLGASEDIEATANGMEAITSKNPAHVIDCGESGSTLRFLVPIAAMTGEEWLFTGRGRLMERPQGVYAELFAKHGVFFARENAGIRVRGPLPAGVYRLPGNVSSQFVTGLLLALPLAEGDSALELTSPLESADYVALTLQTMDAFGARAEERRGADGGVDGYIVKGGQRYRPAEYTVEGDWSQAAFFLCAAALGRDVAVAGLDPASRQGDRRIVGILERMGVSTSWETGSLSPAADTRDERKTTKAVLRAAVSAGGLRGAEIDARDIPDIVPPLAALACFAKGATRITGAGRLRIKESDRLRALAQELARLGADISEEEDGLTIRGRAPGLLPGGDVDAHGDHRIAMAMAVAAIGCGGPVRLAGAQSVAKSYPGFWDDFEARF